MTDSTESPHSDKLIMCHVTAVIATVITEYGLSLAYTFRKDLVATFSSLTTEVLSLAKDGAELMIESGWLEKMPQTADRKELIN